VTVSPAAPAAPDPRLYAILAEAGFGDDLFNPRQHRSCELVDCYADALALDIVDRLGLRAMLEAPRTVAELLDGAGLVAGFTAPLRWLLERLASTGVARADGVDAARRYALAPSVSPVDREAIRAECLDLSPSYAPAFALLDEAAAIYPRVARGEVSGEKALFQKIALWVSYFSNDNAYYALNNRVTARAAATRLIAAPGTVLEVGAGLGSATAALLEELARRHASAAATAYRATEPVVFFRRRAERMLSAAHPSVPFAFADLDLNRPWTAQGIEPGSIRLVWGVNVFHLARNLDAVLREAHDALAPGGWLVVGEGIRPQAGIPVGAELPFQLLESFVSVETDPRDRPTPGFLTAEQWLAAVGRAGFENAELVPDALRLRAVYPAFFAAAVCARRPMASETARPGI
jgi:SAM-dependent methyltransferase